MKNKTVTGYILLEDGKPATFDERMPVYWKKGIASLMAEQECIDAEIVKCTVTYETQTRGER